MGLSLSHTIYISPVSNTSLQTTSNLALLITIILVIVNKRQAHLQQKRQKQAWFRGAHLRGGSMAPPVTPYPTSPETPAPLHPKVVSKLTEGVGEGSGVKGQEDATAKPSLGSDMPKEQPKR